MKILFMGTSDYSLTVLKAISLEHEIIAVVTQPDAVVGRKKRIVFPKVKQWANENEVQVFQPMKLSREYKELLTLDFDILVTAAYGQFVPTKLLNKGKYISLNAHASLLPKYRGGSPIQSAIKNGEKYLGVTIMEMVKQMDAGRIAKQEKIKLAYDDTGESMFIKLADLAAKMMLTCLRDVDNIDFVAQDDSKATFAYNITHEDERLHFDSSAKDIYNHIRGYYSNPLTYTRINGKNLKVYQAEESTDNSDKPNGTVLEVNKFGIKVKCRDGAILLKEIQLEGKKRMMVRDFINGNRTININDVFEGE